MATPTPPSIGIIGAGELGSNIARAMAARGVAATIANRRGPASLTALIDELGPTITAATTEDAAAADIVVAAVRWVDAPDIFGKLPAWEGRIVVDPTNAVEFLEPDSPETRDPSNPLAGQGLRLVDLGGETSSRVFSRLVPGARVVRAFNHLNVSLLSHPEASGGRRVLFYSGDDADARAAVGGVIESLGFFPVDLGPLDVGAPLVQMALGSLAGINFIAQ